jgi:hypothetical protein
MWLPQRGLGSSRSIDSTLVFQRRLRCPLRQVDPVVPALPVGGPAAQVDVGVPP